MKTAWTEDAWQEYLQWQQDDQKILTAINELIRDIKRDPFKGLGNQSPLNLRFKTGGRAGSRASTVWFIAFPVKTNISNSISSNAATTTNLTFPGGATGGSMPACRS
jgi:Txe/YoeB family toxin of toxin-antitoxin system